MNRRVWTIVTGIVVLAVCTACGGTPSSPPAGNGTSPTGENGEPGSQQIDDPVPPPDPSLGLTPVTSPEGTAHIVVPGLEVALPEVAREDDSVKPAGSATTVTYRFGPEGEDFPALQVSTAGATADSLAAVSWVDEATMRADAAVTQFHRSTETWPEAAEAVATAWTQDIALVDGDSVTVDVLTLWLKSASGDSYKVIAYAPHGELEGSAVEQALLSAVLVPVTA